jgi:hypothetical protein
MCNRCFTQSMPHETPCPHADEHEEMRKYYVEAALALSEGAEAFSFKPNGGSMLATLYRLWFLRGGVWVPTHVTFMSDTDRWEMRAISNALEAAGVHRDVCVEVPPMNKTQERETTQDQGDGPGLFSAVLIAVLIGIVICMAWALGVVV